MQRLRRGERGGSWVTGSDIKPAAIRLTPPDQCYGKITVAVKSQINKKSTRPQTRERETDRNTQSRPCSLSDVADTSPARRWLCPHAQPAVITVCVCARDVRRDSCRSSLSSSPAPNNTLSSDTYTSSALHPRPKHLNLIRQCALIYQHSSLYSSSSGSHVSKYCLKKETVRRSSIELPSMLTHSSLAGYTQWLLNENEKKKNTNLSQSQDQVCWIRILSECVL